MRGTSSQRKKNAAEQAGIYCICDSCERRRIQSLRLETLSVTHFSLFFPFFFSFSPPAVFDCAAALHWNTDRQFGICAKEVLLFKWNVILNGIAGICFIIRRPPGVGGRTRRRMSRTENSSNSSQHEHCLHRLIASPIRSINFLALTLKWNRIAINLPLSSLDTFEPNTHSHEHTPNKRKSLWQKG